MKVKTYRKVLIYSLIIYILGLILGPLSALIFPETGFRWKESLLISTPALFLIGIIYFRQSLEWKTYRTVLLGVGLASIVLFFIQVIPTIIPVLIILALAGMYISSHPKTEQIISAVKNAL